MYSLDLRYLMKCYEHAKSREAMDTYSTYLVQKNFDSPNFSGDLSHASLINALGFRAKRLVCHVTVAVPCWLIMVLLSFYFLRIITAAASLLNKKKQQGLDQLTAWNEASILLEQAAVVRDLKKPYRNGISLSNS